MRVIICGKRSLIASGVYMTSRSTTVGDIVHMAKAFGEVFLIPVTVFLNVQYGQSAGVIKLISGLTDGVAPPN